jgi:hypothetical protein
MMMMMMMTICVMKEAYRNKSMNRAGKRTTVSAPQGHKAKSKAATCEEAELELELNGWLEPFGRA